MTNINFLNKLKPLVIKNYENSKILPSVASAQAVLESGWGESELAVNSNNIYGIKGKFKGKSYKIRTEEYINGKSTTVVAAFRKYPTIEDSIVDHGEFFVSTDWRKSVYSEVLKAKDYKSQAKALGESPYATNPNYSNLLLNIIEQHGLYEWDKEATGKKSVPFVSPIEYLVSQGFRITSDPSQYYESYSPNRGKKPWGKRDLWERWNGTVIYHDEYCGGWHRAHDLSDKEGADLPAVVDGIIVDGTKQNGNFGGTVVLADHNGDYQYIYGHVKNIRVKVGDKVKQGDKLAEQSNTNYYNNPMNSHLHFQVQEQEYLAEKEFVCSGLNPDNINVNDYVGTPASVSTPKKEPTKTEKKESTDGYTVKKGDTLWSLSRRFGTTVSELKSLNGLKNNVLHIGQVLKVDNPNAKQSTHTVVKGDTLWSISQRYDTTVDSIKSLNGLSGNTLSVGQKLRVGASKPKPKFNKMTNRKLSKSALFKGTVDKAGAEIRNRSGNNFSKKAGYDLKAGDEVYIFQVAGSGWGKIYTSRTSGNGSNDWIWLERLNVTQVF